MITVTNVANRWPWRVGRFSPQDGDNKTTPKAWLEFLNVNAALNQREVWEVEIE